MILEKKECNTCKKEKDVNEFEFRKDLQKHRNQCIYCRKKYLKEYRKSEKGKEADLRYRKSEKYQITRKKRRELRKFSEEFKEKRKINLKIRMKIDNVFLLKIKIRKTVKKSLQKKGFTKKSKTYDILGCSYKEFLKHLESLFEPWMNWENKGLYEGGLFNYGWDIDHKIPLSSANTEEEVIKLNHYTNLQPLCSCINREIKKDNINFNSN